MGLGILPPPGVAAPKAPDVQDFTTSGTWTKPAGAKWVRAELIGGGGGAWSAAAGGGGGEYVSMVFDAADLAPSEPVTVGVGGASNSSSDGVTGGMSSFGGINARGGLGADYGFTPVYAAGGGVGVTAIRQVTTQPYTIDVPATFAGAHGNSAGGTISKGSLFGAGGGNAATSTVVLGGQSAVAFGALKAGDGGTDTLAATAPGGGAGKVGAGATGAARITTYF